MSPNMVSLSALQAQRASAMQHTVGAEYDQPAHTFLAEKLPDNPELHRQIVLPGAKRAIHLDALEAFHQRGLSEVEIVAEVNAMTDQALAPRRQQFETWRDGELADRMTRAREREQRRIALMSGRQAEIERLLDSELGPQ